MDTLDLYTAEKLVAGKQAKLRAEAQQTALRAALPKQSRAGEVQLPIRAVETAERLMRRCATIAWSWTVKGTAVFARANR